MKTCSKCNTEKSLVEFNKDKSTKDKTSYWCKSCMKEYKETRVSKTKEYNKKWNLENKEHAKSYNKVYQKKWQILKKDDHYSVYLLPDSNYVGMTNNMYNRMNNHKCHHNRRVDNVEILHVVDTRQDALHKEVWYHRLGFEGAKQ